MKNLYWDNIEQVWGEYYEWYSENNLNEKMIELFPKPNVKDKKVSQKTFAFLLLWCNICETVSKDELTESYRLLFPNYKRDFQAGRHIGNDTGYNVMNHSHGIKGYCLKDKNCQSIKFHKHVSLNNVDWEKIKENYGFECPCCGSKEGEKMKKANGITKLEKGHMNPDKPLTIDNIIPQCQYCNKSSKNNKKFNKKGDTIAIKNKQGKWSDC
jgi:hypothetical protein